MSFVADQYAAIARLNALIARLRARRKRGEPGEPGELDPSLRPRPSRSVLLLGSPQMEHQAQAQGSDRGLNTNYDKQQPRAPRPTRTGDRTLDRLSYAYRTAAYKCRQKNIDDNVRYYQCRAKKGGSARKCQHLFKPTNCPEAEAARKALSEYLEKRSNSGGGGGGGF